MDFFSNEWKGIGLIIFLVLVFIGIGCGAYAIVHMQYSKIDNDTISIVSSDDYTISAIYGEELDLSQFTIEYQTKKHDGIKTKKVTSDMVLNYDQEIIGKQVITISYKTKSIDVELTTYPATLMTPTIRFLNNQLQWDNVNHATGYILYEGNDLDNLNVVDDSIADTSYDLSDYTTIGEAYFSVQAVCSDERYDNSEISSQISVYVMAEVSNVAYVDSKITWDAVEGASNYTVIINGVKYTGITTNYMEYNARAVDKSIITVCAYSTNANTVTNKSSELVIQKLSTPVILIENNMVVCDDNSQTVEYYLDGVLFDGDLSAITEVGTYTIEAKYIAQSALYLDSEMATITCTKLNTPTITMESSILKVDDSSKTVQWYLDGVAFDGDVKSLNAGTYNITAKYISNGYEIDSNISEAYSITVYEAPVVSYSKRAFTCTSENINLKYYIDGVEFNGDVKTLSKGVYTVSAINVGDGITTLSSSSCDINIYYSAVNVSFTVLTNNKVRMDLEYEDSINYDFDVYFYSGTELIDFISYDNCSDAYRTLSLSRGETISDRFIVIIKVYNVSNTAMYDELEVEYK